MRPIGLWSTSMTLSSCLEAVDAACAPGARAWRRCSCARERAGRGSSFTSVDLPEPETPVTAVKQPERERRRRRPAGCARAPRRPSSLRSGPVAGAAGGAGIARRPRQVGAGERRPACASSSATSPEATTRPPCSPAPGPMSITWSAARIVSSSCSTTITVLPRSRSARERLDQPVGCRAGAGRSSARRARRARPTSPAADLASPAGSAGPRRRRACAAGAVERSGSRARRRRRKPSRSADLLEDLLGDRALAAR